MFQPSAPPGDYAQPELRALLDQGVEPLKAWLRTLISAPRTLGFHVTNEWDNTVLACYLSHFLPRLPPTQYWQQDVLVIHQPEHWENGAYNRIFTQMSGNCLIPDVFHKFLLALTRAFGKRFIPAWELIYWMERGDVPEQAVSEHTFLQDQRLQASIGAVEAREGGVVEQTTIHVLNPFGTLEWLGMLSLVREDHPTFYALHVTHEQIRLCDALEGAEIGQWFDEMRERGYLPRSPNRVPQTLAPLPQTTPHPLTPEKEGNRGERQAESFGPGLKSEYKQTENEA